MAKPIIRAVGAFDAGYDRTIAFEFGGGMVTGSEVIIRKNSTNAMAYTDTSIGMATECVIPAGMLTNNEYYNMQIRVSYKNAAGTSLMSEWSDAITFRCYTTAVIVANLESGAVITTSSCPINFEYSQSENDPINEYVVTARGEDGEIVWTSGTVYPSVSTLPYSFSANISGLEDEHSYTIECICHSASGIEASLAIAVSVVYTVATSYQRLYVRNVSERAAVRIETNIDPIDGVYDEAQGIPMISGGWVDLLDKEVEYSKDELLPADGYQIALIVKNPKLSEDLLVLETTDGERIILRYMKATIYGKGECSYVVLYAGDYTIMSETMNVLSDNSELYIQLIYADGYYSLDAYVLNEK